MDLLSHCNQDAKLFDIKLQSCYVLERHYVLPPCLIVKWFSLVVECVIPWSVNHENVANGFTDFRTFQLLQTTVLTSCTIAKSIVAQNHGATVKQQHVAPSRFGADGQQKTKFLAYLLSAQAILVE